MHTATTSETATELRSAGPREVSHARKAAPERRERFEREVARADEDENAPVEVAGQKPVEPGVVSVISVPAFQPAPPPVAPTATVVRAEPTPASAVSAPGAATSPALVASLELEPLAAKTTTSDVAPPLRGPSIAPPVQALPVDGAPANETAPARPAELAEQRAADVLRQVRMQLVPATREATLRLDPPELGSIAIKLVVRDGTVDAVLEVEERATLDLLAKHIPELRATLERAGMHAGAFDLQLGLGDERRAAAERPRHSRASSRASIEAPCEVQRALTVHLGRDSAVDTYA